MAVGKDWTLRRPLNAPLLNPYVDYAEKVLKELQNSLGDRGANTLTAEQLAKNAGELPGDGDLAEKFQLKDQQIAAYKEDWNTLDNQIAALAALAADDANGASGTFEDLRDAVIDIVDSVPDNPTTRQQLDAVVAIDITVGATIGKLQSTHNELENKSLQVPQDSSGSKSGGVPASSLLGGSNSPSSSASSDSDDDSPGEEVTGTSGRPTKMPTGDLAEWIDQAIEVLRENGYDVKDSDAAIIATMIEKESSGNPNAINLWDSNAEAGTPSKGLMQTIDPTFDAHALPGHGDIWNPVDNICAGAAYAIDRYGSLSDVPGIVNMSQGAGYVGY
ncbi:transglycosylase SLT domain-containing protein [Nocardia sp. NBC_01329]|uniref:transglycosylase SLT domain-containing protein n=1 Tax=Nocardia sp. NBC_01329 TaxID=2903594 RepID=UPI002E12A88E|nr:transglycosylase SLT domain-containing protein [Nocardia sp. NBC_01329]